MTGSTNLEFWQLMTVALGPALLTSVVAIYAPIAVEFFKSRSSKTEIREQKFQELVTAVFEFDDWLSTFITNTAGSEFQILESSALAKMYAISILYFPQFEQSIRSLEDSSLTARRTAARLQYDRIEGKNHSWDTLSEPLEAYNKHKHQLLLELSQFARKTIAVKHFK
ncbi:hypothetical protein [Nitratireductor sp. XY-223]|uniref:hypothetical protein n=1 Tax=Nitratireductor sp. XY-223 TaxID=2561926 RepID=UPI0010AA543F|nr:hypothetical protein [Nitratireductor sp. XY-223]